MTKKTKSVLSARDYRRLQEYIYLLQDSVKVSEHKSYKTIKTVFMYPESTSYERFQQIVLDSLIYCSDNKLPDWCIKERVFIKTNHKIISIYSSNPSQ